MLLIHLHSAMTAFTAYFTLNVKTGYKQGLLCHSLKNWTQHADLIDGKGEKKQITVCRVPKKASFPRICHTFIHPSVILSVKSQENRHNKKPHLLFHSVFLLKFEWTCWALTIRTFRQETRLPLPRQSQTEIISGRACSFCFIRAFLHPSFFPSQ